MSQELVYTSAPRGLKPGSKGFCTVAMTIGLPAAWVERLETLSGYRPLFPLGNPKSGQNPVSYCHWRLQVSGQTRSVLSRVAFAGADYSQRSNKLASLVAIEPAEQSPAGPAYTLLHGNVVRDSWTGDPQRLPKGPPLPKTDRPPAVCATWARHTGDAGWAAALADAFIADKDRPVFLVYPLSAADDVLPLFEEALSLLPPKLRWQVTFNTYFTDLPLGLTCAWRGVVAGSDVLKSVGRGLVIDLLDLRGKPTPDSAAATAAREGTAVRAPAEKQDRETTTPSLALPAETHSEPERPFQPVLRRRSLDLPLEPLGATEKWRTPGRTYGQRKRNTSRLVLIASVVIVALIVGVAALVLRERRRSQTADPGKTGGIASNSTTQQPSVVVYGTSNAVSGSSKSAPTSTALPTLSPMTPTATRATGTSIAPVKIGSTTTTAPSTAAVADRPYKSQPEDVPSGADPVIVLRAVASTEDSSKYVWSAPSSAMLDASPALPLSIFWSKPVAGDDATQPPRIEVAPDKPAKAFKLRRSSSSIIFSIVKPAGGAGIDASSTQAPIDLADMQLSQGQLVLHNLTAHESYAFGHLVDALSRSTLTVRPAGKRLRLIYNEPKVINVRNGSRIALPGTNISLEAPTKAGAFWIVTPVSLDDGFSFIFASATDPKVPLLTLAIKKEHDAYVASFEPDTMQAHRLSNDVKQMRKSLERFKSFKGSSQGFIFNAPKPDILKNCDAINTLKTLETQCQALDSQREVKNLDPKESKSAHDQIFNSLEQLGEQLKTLDANLSLRTFSIAVDDRSNLTPIATITVAPVDNAFGDDDQKASLK